MTKKKLIFLIKVLVSIFLIFGLFNFLIDHYLKNLAIKQVELKTNGNSTLSIRKFHLNLFNSGIEARDVILKREDSLTSYFIGKEISIGGINLMDLFMRKKINIGSIRIENSTIIYHREAEEENKGDTTNKLVLYDLIKDKFKSLFVNEIHIINPSVFYFKNSTDKSPLISSSGGEIRMKNLHVDSSTAHIQNRSFSSDSLSIYLRNLESVVGDSLYTIRIPGLLISYEQRKMIADSFQLIPNFSKVEFSKIVGEQTDRFTIFTKSILVDSVDVKRLIEKLELNARVLNIDSMHVNIYRDKYVTSIWKKKKFIQELVNGIEIPFDLAEINISRSFVEYAEFIPPAPKPGKIFFSEIQGKLNNISNLPSKQNEILTLNASGKLNDISLMENHLNFPMDRKTFYGHGSIKNVEMKEMNPMLEPSTSASITNGHIDSMMYALKADSAKVTGTFRMIYKDLRVAVKDVAKSDTSKTVLRIESFIANNFVIKKSNPDKKGKIRDIQLRRQYDPDGFMISNLWKTLLMGTQETIGINAKKKPEAK